MWCSYLFGSNFVWLYFNIQWSNYIVILGPYFMEDILDFNWAALTFALYTFYMFLVLQPIGLVSITWSATLDEVMVHIAARQEIKLTISV